jgi:anti-sigma factor ChrR (cupin superfamily)
MTEPYTLKGLLQRVGTPVTDWDDWPWTPFREGVEACWLHHGDGTTGASALLRYAPGARVPLHEHPDVEHILVLSGSQADERATYSAGDVAIQPPGSRHTVASTVGCVVLLIWARPVRVIGT